MPRKKLGRPRAGRERLTRERILGAALRIVDEEGMGALSMRQLAGELGVDPMSIYHHLPGKQAVVSGLVERVFSRMELPSFEGLSWRERVRAWVRAYRDLARAHPNLVLQIVSDAAAVSDAMLRISEPLYAALEDAGLPPRKVSAAAGTVVDFVHGNALAEDSATSSEEGSFERDLLARLEAQPEESSPAMRRVFRAFARDTTQTDSVSSLDVIIAGIEAVSDGADG